MILKHTVLRLNKEFVQCECGNPRSLRLYFTYPVTQELPYIKVTIIYSKFTDLLKSIWNKENVY